MKTPFLNAEITALQQLKNTSLRDKKIIEYKKIKQLLESIKQKETNKRYFIVSFTGLNNLGNATGFIDFSTDGCFLSLKTTVKQIKEKQGLKECVITNIMEISEQDWNDWNN